MSHGSISVLTLSVHWRPPPTVYRVHHILTGALGGNGRSDRRIAATGCRECAQDFSRLRRGKVAPSLEEVAAPILQAVARVGERSAHRHRWPLRDGARRA